MKKLSSSSGAGRLPILERSQVRTCGRASGGEGRVIPLLSFCPFTPRLCSLFVPRSPFYSFYSFGFCFRTPPYFFLYRIAPLPSTHALPARERFTRAAGVQSQMCPDVLVAYGSPLISATTRDCGSVDVLYRLVQYVDVASRRARCIIQCFIRSHAKRIYPCTEYRYTFMHRNVLSQHK